MHQAHCLEHILGIKLIADLLKLSVHYTVPVFDSYLLLQELDQKKNGAIFVLELPSSHLSVLIRFNSVFTALYAIK